MQIAWEALGYASRLSVIVSMELGLLSASTISRWKFGSKFNGVKNFNGFYIVTINKLLSTTLEKVNLPACEMHYQYKIVLNFWMNVQMFLWLKICKNVLNVFCI